MGSSDPRQKPVIPDREVEVLARDVQGSVLPPGRSGYDEERLGFNRLLDQHPALVVAATGAPDVALAVRFAADHGLPVAVKGTGHGPSIPADGAMLITTERMARVAIDTHARTARIGAGTTWGEVIEAAPAGLAPLSGSSPTVGAIGYSTGGGLPIMCRSHGWAADRIRSLELVAADGQVRTASSEENEDLFWGVCGGKGNFGVITEMETELVAVEDLFAGALIFPGDSAPQVLHAYREWITAVPQEMSSSAALMRLPDMPMIPEPLRGRFIVALRICFVGRAEDGTQLVEPLRALGERIMDSVGPMPYSQSWAIHMDPQDPLPWIDGTAVLSEFGEATVDAVLSAAGPGADTSILLAEVRPLGGALADQPPSPNAVGHRNAPFNFFAVSPAFPGTEGVVSEEVRTALEAVRPFETGGVLLNFLGVLDTNPATVRRAFEPEIYQRLVALKTAYDPDNLFRLNHNIPPAGRLA